MTAPDDARTGAAAMPPDADFAAQFWRSRAVVDDLQPPSPVEGVDPRVFQLLADNLPTLCWIARGDGYIVWYNRRWHDYCGTTALQMEGWGWQSVHDPASLPGVMSRWVDAITRGVSFEMTFPLRGADGVFRPFLTRVQPMHDTEGRIVRWFGVNTEVSAQVEAEAALRRESDRSRAVIENMAEGFVLLDHAWRVVDINDEGLRLEQRPRAAIVGRTHWEAWPGSEFTELGAAYKRAMAGRKHVQLEHCYAWPDGRTNWFEMRAFPVGEGLAVFYRDVTDRRLAAARLERSEDHYRNAVELNPQTVWTATSDGRLDRVGRRWFEWTGTSGLGDSWGEVMHDDDLGRTVDAWTHSVATGEPYDITHRARMRDGSYRWMRSRASPRRDAADRIVQWYGTTQDIHDERAAQAALSASEERFRTVAETMPGFVWTADERGQLDYTSPHWHSYAGVDPSASNGNGWSQFVHPDDQATTFERWRTAVATAVPYESTFRLRRADGVYRWWMTRARPIVMASGGTMRWVGTCTDLDDLIAARETLARSREQLEQLVAERTQERDRIWRLIPDLLVSGIIGGPLLSVNPACMQTLGYDEEFLLSDSMQQIVHPDHVLDTERAMQELRAGRVARHQSRLRARDGGDRWFDWVSTPVGDRFYAVARDITERKRHEQALEAAEQALRQSQKMEAIGQLTGGIAHDFNNMLAVVIGSLELVGRRLDGADARARRYIDAATDGARRAALLTQRLLSFARQQPLKPETVDVNALVTGMCDLLRHSLGADVRLTTELATDLWPAKVDPNQLESALLNLGVNARDAMPDGGQLVIATQNTLTAADGNGTGAGEHVLVSVTDTGTGMPPEVLAKAFDPFFTTKQVGKGTGLGLSQVYGFVTQSGGTVRARSEAGQGTTISILLPRFSGDAPADAAAIDRSVVRRARHGELILVVEDETAVRTLGVDSLHELGYRTVAAAGGAEALQLLAAHPAIDLLFTDVVMPEMSGTRLAEEARRRRPGLRVLFASGYAPTAVAPDWGPDGDSAMIAKPYSLAALGAKIREVLDAPAPADPVV